MFAEYALNPDPNAPVVSPDEVDRKTIEEAGFKGRGVQYYLGFHHGQDSCRYDFHITCRLRAFCTLLVGRKLVFGRNEKISFFTVDTLMYFGNSFSFNLCCRGTSALTDCHYLSKSLGWKGLSAYYLGCAMSDPIKDAVGALLSTSTVTYPITVSVEVVGSAAADQPLEAAKGLNVQESRDNMQNAEKARSTSEVSEGVLKVRYQYFYLIQ